MISLPPPPEIPPRPTFALVDLAAIRHNVRAVRSLAGKARIMGIVKANAYGHGLVTIARQLLAEGVDELGVGFLEEGVELRRAGIRVPILVLGGIFEDQIPWFLRYGLDLAASSVFKIDQIERAAEACGVRARVHLKIDTGMGRIGVQWDTAHQLFERAVKASHLQ
ncbi:MAG TPA: alanine racemase, partial [Polyangiaceae bacterium]|nr:alanine racemase [Polyangiaceae bacterium]